ncbi:MAG: SDR family oxidoreductase [Thermoflavifilum sp.]|nr:SDR family oxidoreductase [Thermoflavifilum sp.]
MELSLAGKTACIGGASQGIGLATAIELSRLGASCILMSRNEYRLQAALEKLDHSQGQQHRYAVVDFASLEQVSKTASWLVDQGVVHILVNNSGGPAPGPLLEAHPEAFEKAFREHLLASQLLVQALVPGMRSQGYGRIIQVLSTSVKAPIVGLGVSTSIRWAVAGWAKVLAQELAPMGITVNAVLPGSTLTTRLEELFVDSSRRQQVSVEQIKQQAEQQIPMKRFAQPHEIAQAIAFLASPAAAYITGVFLQVDGGKTPVG